MKFFKDTSFTATAAKFLQSAHDLVARESGIEPVLINGQPQHVLFTVNGEPVWPTDLGYALGLFPLFIWRADKIQESASGFRFGFGYRPNTDSFLRYEISVDTTTETQSEVLLFVIEAFDECRRLLPRDPIHKDAVELSGLIAEFSHDMEQRFDVQQRPASALRH